MKKANLFFSSTVQDQMKNNTDFRQSRGFKKALKIFHQILIGPVDEGTAKYEIGQKVASYFSQGSYENKEIQDSVVKCCRMEGLLTIKSPQSLLLLITFYRKGKEWVLRLDFEINIELGLIDANGKIAFQW